jgi:pyruvate dehydrogenase E1 component beta subunit
LCANSRCQFRLENASVFVSIDFEAAMRTTTYAEAICEALIESGRRDPHVIFFGDGVDDPCAVYGITKGLREVVGAARVIEFPMAESALMDSAVEAALVGKRPVISFHRVEFALLALDKILNNVGKTPYISGGNHKVPLVIRVVVDYGWGQGHSQSQGSLFAKIPGIKVVMPAVPADAKGLLTAAIEDDNPVVVMEHRLCRYVSGYGPDGYYRQPLDGPRVVVPGRHVTIVANSYMTLEALRVAKALALVGIETELIDTRVLRPLVIDTVVESVGRTGLLLTVDTGWRTLGMGAEIVAEVVSRSFGSLKAPPIRLGMPEHPTPSSRGMVPEVYPDAIGILNAVAILVGATAETIASPLHTLENQAQGLAIFQMAN